MIDLYIVELGTALNLNLHPIRLSLCNSHTEDYAKGLSASVENFQLKLFLNEASRTDQDKFSFKPNPRRSQYNSQKLAKSRVSLYDEPTNLNNISIASSHQSVMLSSLNSSSISSIDSFDNDLLNNKTINENILNSRAKIKPPDSDDFNYWFECFNFSTGSINFDLTLDKGLYFLIVFTPNYILQCNMFNPEFITRFFEQ